VIFTEITKRTLNTKVG